ncbi:MAG TPA: phosphoglycerate mutase family protein, partial [Thermoanaerobaculia bacterium]
AALLALGLLACTSTPGAEAGGSPAATNTTAVVYLARHGETEGEDPVGRWLSAAGRARAEALAEELAGAGIETIYTTDYRRTRETAAPLAERLGLEPVLYDPDDLAGFAARLREELGEAGGTVLVMGHSNTTNELVAFLGGEPGTPIAEDEHDRLYRVELPSGATELLRFGPPAAEPETGPGPDGP